MTKPVADLDVFMGKPWADMGSFVGSFNYKHLRRVKSKATGHFARSLCSI